ncbi:MAG: nuclear transport factor 2 family protein [Actinomycetota bacterium]
MSPDEELVDLRRRVARLEAKEAVLATFNAYTYLMDVGHPELVGEVFAPDAQLHLVNFPPGTQTDSTLTGEQIRRLYDDHAPDAAWIKGGHHTTNVGVRVADDLASAELSAYFLTSTPKGVQGGQYRVRLAPDGDRWLVQEMQIASGWGWTADTTRATEYVEAARVWDDGRPVRWA